MMHVNTGVPYTLAKSTICYYLATSQCLPLLPMQPPFEVSIGQYDIGKWLYGFMKFGNPWNTYQLVASIIIG